MLSTLAALVLQQSAVPPDAFLTEWLAPAGCPTHAQAVAMLRPVRTPDVLTARVRIDAPRTPSAAWRAVIITDVSAQTRSRVVEAVTCEAVTRAAVLVLDLARTQRTLEDPSAATPVPVTEPPLPFEPAVDEPEPPPSTPADDEEPRRPRPFRLRLRLSPMLAANVGLFPSFGVALGLGISFGNETWRLELAAFSWSAHRQPGERVEYGLISGLVRGCRLFTVSRVALGPCATVEAGSLQARGVGFAESRQGQVGWVAVFASGKAHFEATTLIQPWVSLDVGANLIRPQFAVNTPDGYELVHRVGFPMGRLTIGVEFRWE